MSNGNGTPPETSPYMGSIFVILGAFILANGGVALVGIGSIFMGIYGVVTALKD